MPLRALVAAVLAFCDEFFPGRAPERVTIRFRGDPAPVVLPVVAGTATPAPGEGSGVPAAGPVKSPGCASAVLRVLARSYPVPMTEPAIADALDDSGESYSESALLKTLAQLVALNILANPPGAKPRGYRFAGEG